MKKLLLTSVLFLFACSSNKAPEAVAENQPVEEAPDTIESFSGKSHLFNQEFRDVLIVQLKHISAFEKDNFQCGDLQSVNSIQVSPDYEKWEIMACDKQHTYDVKYVPDGNGNHVPQISYQ